MLPCLCQGMFRVTETLESMCPVAARCTEQWLPEGGIRTLHSRVCVLASIFHSFFQIISRLLFVDGPQALVLPDPKTQP